MLTVDSLLNIGFRMAVPTSPDGCGATKPSDNLLVNQESSA
uniref:Uncharacterized protein n=1 Tax=Setaria italica TaxID=4555 RepID=K3YNN5_SETIT